MTKLLLASLLALPALAFAQPAPPTPPGPPPPGSRPHTCKQQGTPLFEIDENKSAVTKLYSDGAFDNQTFDDKGKLASDVSGCMEDKDLRRVTNEIHAAPWKVQTDAIHCMAISSDITTYKVNGKIVYAARLCGDPLDAASEAARRDVADTLAKLTDDPLTHSPGKPVK